MLRRTFCFWGAGLVVGACSSVASALTEQIDVTPTWLAEQPDGGKEFTVATAEKDGLIEFTVDRKAFEPRVRLAKLEVRSGGVLLADALLFELEQERRVVYQMRVAPAAIKESVFELSESPFIRTEKEEVPFGGAKIYRLRLADFFQA